MSLAASLTVLPETPDQPEARAMLAASDAYMAALYPPQSNHLLGATALAAEDVRFVMARRDGIGVGCGALVLARDGSAELKRMWVNPEARAQGIGWHILEVLERIARTEGVLCLRLEMGIHQPQATALYRRAGFTEIAPFGAYAPDPLSIFMEKRLD